MVVLSAAQPAGTSTCIPQTEAATEIEHVIENEQVDRKQGCENLHLQGGLEDLVRQGIMTEHVQHYRGGAVSEGGAPQPMSASNSAKLAVPSMGPLRVTAIAPLAQA